VSDTGSYFKIIKIGCYMLKANFDFSVSLFLVHNEPGDLVWNVASKMNFLLLL